MNKLKSRTNRETTSIFHGKVVQLNLGKSINTNTSQYKCMSDLAIPIPYLRLRRQKIPIIANFYMLVPCNTLKKSIHILA